MNNNDPRTSEVLLSIEKKLDFLIVKIEKLKDKLIDFSHQRTDNQ